MAGLKDTRFVQFFEDRPWGKGLVVLLALSVSFLTEVPIISDTWFRLLMTSAIVYFFISEAVFKTLFIVFVLLSISTALFLFLDAALEFDKLERIEAITRIVKAVSLFTILAEGVRGAFFAANLPSGDQSGWKGVTFAGMMACLFSAIILIIFVNPLMDGFLTSSLLGSGAMRPLWLTILVNAIAIIPIAFFLYGNWRIVNSSQIDRKSYIYRICWDYLCYVNMPGIIGSLFLFLFAMILQSMLIPIDQIKVLISGGMTFLVFSAVLVGHLIEQRNRENAGENTTVTHSGSPLPPEQLEEKPA